MEKDLDNKTPTAFEPPREETGLTQEDLLKAFETLKKDNSFKDEPIQFIAWFTTWERIISFFSPSYALKLWGDRQIRQWGKERSLSPDVKNTSAQGVSK